MNLSELSDPNVGRFPISGTRVSLELLSTSHDEFIAAIDILMCVILGMDKLGEEMAGDPLENGKVVFDYGGVQLTLQDEGSPHGRFTNDIGFSTLRGLAEWMTKYTRYKEIKATVFYNNVYFVGSATVRKIGMSTGAANGTVASTALNSQASSAGAAEVATA